MRNKQEWIVLKVFEGGTGSIHDSRIENIVARDLEGLKINGGWINKNDSS